MWTSTWKYLLSKFSWILILWPARVAQKWKESINIKLKSDIKPTELLQAEKYLVWRKTCGPQPLTEFSPRANVKATEGSVRGRPPSEGQNPLTFSPSRFCQPQTGHFFLMTGSLYPTSPPRCRRLLQPVFRPGGRVELEGRTSLSVWLQRPHLMRVLRLNEHLLWLPRSRINPISQCL